MKKRKKRLDFLKKKEPAVKVEGKKTKPISDMPILLGTMGGGMTMSKKRYLSDILNNKTRELF